MISATDNVGLSATDIIEVSINLLTGLNDEFASVKIYPNPTTQFLNISTNNNFKSYRILDYSGKIHEQKHLLKDKIDVSKFARGVYLLELTGSNELKYSRFLKAKKN